MLYLDTSLLVAALTNESETERMQRWLGQQQRDDLAISDWVTTEFSSALSAVHAGFPKRDQRSQFAFIEGSLAARPRTN
jgi:predicted nucleic acid-binding protein